MVWSNNDNRGVHNKFNLCWTNGEMSCEWHTAACPETTLSRSITGLQAATKYNVSVAQYTKDEKTLGEKTQKAAITRSG